MIKHACRELVLPRPMGLRFSKKRVGDTVEIDEKMVGLIESLWAAGFDTHSCCEGGEFEAYIGFDGPATADLAARRLGFRELPKIHMKREGRGAVTHVEEPPAEGAYVELWTMWDDSVLRMPATQETYDRRVA